MLYQLAQLRFHFGYTREYGVRIFRGCQANADTKETRFPAQKSKLPVNAAEVMDEAGNAGAVGVINEAFEYRLLGGWPREVHIARHGDFPGQRLRKLLPVIDHRRP